MPQPSGAVLAPSPAESNLTPPPAASPAAVEMSALQLAALDVELGKGFLPLYDPHEQIVALGTLFDYDPSGGKPHYKGNFVPSPLQMPTLQRLQEQLIEGPATGQWSLSTTGEAVGPEVAELIGSLAKPETWLQGPGTEQLLREAVGTLNNRAQIEANIWEGRQDPRYRQEVMADLRGFWGYLGSLRDAIKTAAGPILGDMSRVDASVLGRLLDLNQAARRQIMDRAGDPDNELPTDPDEILRQRTAEPRVTPRGVATPPRVTGRALVRYGEDLSDQFVIPQRLTQIWFERGTAAVKGLFLLLTSGRGPRPALVAQRSVQPKKWLD